MENNSLSVVVPCYNSKKRIVACIDAIKLSLDNLDPKFKFEIIVINDGSTDSTEKHIKKMDRVKVITHSKNKGLSSARNSGIMASSSDFIAFVDSDIEVEKKWFQKMLSLLVNNTSIAGATGHLKPPFSNKSRSLLEKYLFSNYRGSKNIDNKTPLLYKWFVFSNTIIRRSILEKTGLFDEKLISYGGEDTELAIRINRVFPKNLRKCMDAVSIHYSDKTLNQYRKNMFEYGLNNFNHIIEKHPDYKKKLGANLIYSFKGYLIFNSISRNLCLFLLNLIRHPLLVKFLVVSSFVQGVRNSKNS